MCVFPHYRVHSLTTSELLTVTNVYTLITLPLVYTAVLYRGGINIPAQPSDITVTSNKTT